MRPEQEVRVGQVRREIQRVVQLDHRIAIVFLLKQPAAAIEIERRQLRLLFLLGRRQARDDAAGVRQLDLVLDALEPPRHRVAARPIARLVRRREAAGQLALARGFVGVAAGGERRAEHEMRVAVGRVAADRFAQPVDRGLRIAVQQIRVAEIEDVIGIVGVGFGGLGEVERRLARLRRAAAAQLDDAEVVEDGRRRIRIGQRLEGGERVVVLLQAPAARARRESGPRAPTANRRARGATAASARSWSPCSA